jgi:hypothetical protein
MVRVRWCVGCALLLLGAGCVGAIDDGEDTSEVGAAQHGSTSRGGQTGGATGAGQTGGQRGGATGAGPTPGQHGGATGAGQAGGQHGGATGAGQTGGQHGGATGAGQTGGQHGGATSADRGGGQRGGGASSGGQQAGGLGSDQVGGSRGQRGGEVGEHGGQHGQGHAHFTGHPREFRGHRFDNGHWSPPFERGVLVESAQGVDACSTVVVGDQTIVEDCRECISQGGSFYVEDANCI